MLAEADLLAPAHPLHLGTPLPLSSQWKPLRCSSPVPPPRPGDKAECPALTLLTLLEACGIRGAKTIEQKLMLKGKKD